MILASMGVIEGGWEFVWAAYGASAAVLAGYALSIHVRYRAERRRREREKERKAPVYGSLKGRL